MISSFEFLLKDALKKVIKAISRHERNETAPLSIQVLMQVRTELDEMIKFMNPKIYMPGYPRFILDWPDEEGLIEELVDVAYQYGKIINS